jgi:uncharacterized iron-regulated membrane protein
MKFWRKVHKWLGLIVATQILLWISGGVIMSVFPIDKVRGKHLVKPATVLAKPNDLVISANISLTHWQSLSWQQRGNQWLVKAINFKNEIHWLNPNNGKSAISLTDSAIQSIASIRHAKSAPIESIERLTSIPFEVRHLSLPMYQVDFDDWISTTFYISPTSGDIASVRSDIWRLYDFFWMLHIMDYEQREDFNNLLLIVAAISSLAFTITGIILVYFSILKPWYARVKYHRQSKPI